MVDGVREKLELAYRRLSIQADRENRLAEIVDSLEPAAGEGAKKRKRVRKKGVDKVQDQLHRLSVRTQDIINDIEHLHHSSKVALITHRFGGKVRLTGLIDELEQLGIAAETAASSNLDDEMNFSPPKQSVLIAYLILGHYEELTGRRPSESRTPSGEFYKLVDEVLRTLNVEGSTENAVRKAFKMKELKHRKEF